MIKWLITLALALFVLGLLTPWLSRSGFGRLRGDVRFKHARGVFYFPFTSVILLSLALTAILHLFGR
jgi:Protein of unknown function (DUF2905)